jgi:DNA-binding NarL/FixJ family response regulator
MAISVLIVDNDELTRDILMHLVAFRFPNVIIHVTAVFEHALELCGVLKVDMVITTTTRPPDRSDAMLHCLRGIKNDPVKIIIMTSSGEDIRPEGMYNSPNTYLIPKPINMDDLIVMVKDRISDIEAERLSGQGVPENEKAGS